MRILMTGANGFLGQELGRTLESKGHTVFRLVRRPSAPNEFLCNLPSSIDEKPFLLKPDALIHCAYETRSSDPEIIRATNIEGTQRLLALCLQFGVPQFVFISSLAAHEDARSLYGKTKFELEKLVLKNNGLVVKPGTIVGSGGLFSRTRDLVLKNRMIPLFFFDRPRLQTVWVGDLCTLILQAVEKKKTGTVIAASHEAIPFSVFYREIAKQTGRRPLLFPFPGNLMIWVFRFFEKCGLRLPITSENLLGVKHLRYSSSLETQAEFQMTFRTFTQSLALLDSAHPDHTPGPDKKNSPDFR